MCIPPLVINLHTHLLKEMKGHIEDTKRSWVRHMMWKCMLHDTSALIATCKWNASLFRTFLFSFITTKQHRFNSIHCSLSFTIINPDFSCWLIQAINIYLIPQLWETQHWGLLLIWAQWKRHSSPWSFRDHLSQGISTHGYTHPFAGHITYTCTFSPQNSQ